MKINDYSTLNWSEKVNSNSRNVDLLGIWSQHLKIQVEFTRGITSVTNRVRYYTLVSYYFEYLSEIVKDQHDYERIFILTCLAHHNGEYDNLNGVHNKTRFKDNWNEKTNFDLKFKINGQGWSYYVKQLAILRCAWTEYGIMFLSPINTKLADSLKQIDKKLFRHNKFKKDELKELGDEGFCICNTESNEVEIDVMSKLLFGFFSKKDGKWDINEEEYNSFKEGNLNLEIKNSYNPFSDDVLEMSLKRRNTLLMFLKIINETNPFNLEYKRYIWDAVYFKQNRNNLKFIDFGRLDTVRKYWELLQLNVYYVYAIEMYLGIIEGLINDYSVIKKDTLLESLDFDYFYSCLNKITNHKIRNNLTLLEFNNIINELNGNNPTNLSSFLNESFVFDEINAKEWEERLSNILIMLFLLFNRYSIIDDEIKDFAFRDKKSSFHSIFINDVFDFIKENEKMTIYRFLKCLCDLIIRKHLYESTLRLYDSNTKNWLFTEENGFLYSAGKKIGFGTRDNRWDSIKSLLNDLRFLDESDDRIILTAKGIEWLKRIESI